MAKRATKADPTQFERFLETARSLECDPDKERFEARLGKIATSKPQPPRKKISKGK